MKQKVEIHIDKASVYESVRKNSAYIGKKSTVDGVDFERVRLKKEQDEVLEEYFADATSALISTLKHYIKDWGEEEDSLTINLLMPSNWDNSLAGLLDKNSNLYIVNYIIWRWLCISDNDSDLRKLYSANADSMLSSLSRCLFTRCCNKRVPQIEHEWSCCCDHFNDEEL